VRFTCERKSPFWSIVARAIDFQRVPSNRWSATLPPGKSGLANPRSVDASGSWSAEEPTGRARPWHEEWLARDHDYAIVYGHWAMQGLHVVPGIRGLDTGCVWGGRLTAWIAEEDRLVHRKAARAYAAYGA